MRKTFAVTLVCMLSLCICVAQKSSSPSPTKSGSDNAVIEKLEREWASATLKDPAQAVETYEADDIISTDPSGRVTGKEQDRADMKAGLLKFQSLDLTDVKAHMYGNTAVATGTSSVKGTFNGMDISGNYRFTDTWVKRNGKWQVVASQFTKVQ